MSEIDITTVMRRRRMHREFEDRPVPREALEPDLGHFSGMVTTAVLWPAVS